MLQSLHNDYISNIEQQLAVRDLENVIKNSVNELSPKVKQIYKLSREEGLSVREIAEKLKLSEQTVKNQLSTALSHLRKSLSGISAFLISLFWVS
jgi:RNA polymerase sigma-70 factor (ECF subfamily)